MTFVYALAMSTFIEQFTPTNVTTGWHAPVAVLQVQTASLQSELAATTLVAQQALVAATTASTQFTLVLTYPIPGGPTNPVDTLDINFTTSASIYPFYNLVVGGAGALPARCQCSLTIAELVGAVISFDHVSVSGIAIADGTYRNTPASYKVTRQSTAGALSSCEIPSGVYDTMTIGTATAYAVNAGVPAHVEIELTTGYPAGVCSGLQVTFSGVLTSF